MTDPLLATPRQAVTPGVQEFAAEKGLGGYLDGVVELAQQSFPASDLCVSVGQDAEDETHRYIALDIEVGGLAAEELLACQSAWSVGLGRVCPAHSAVYFVLGWR
jgi:hypothetical protein